MAEVFEVRDPASGERRALKLLTELKTSLKRFQREFEAMTRLNHPGIVRVYRYGLHNGTMPWMTMEMLDGRPLQERMAEVGPPGDAQRTLEVMRIGFQLSSALQYIHDRGLVHRDLKSANIQVLRDGRVKLLDFGTAHLVDPLDRITQEGDFVGTFSYAAPEQIVGAKVDHRADIYSFGVLLYRLLTGRRPFKAKDPHEVARMHLEDEAVPILDLVPTLPPALQTLVQRMMQKKRKQRPERAEEIGRELEQIAGQTLSLPGFGLAVYDDRSVGRVEDHQRLWSVLDESAPGHTVVVHGGDAGERMRFTQQAGRDASKRGWTAIGCAPGDDPAAELARALSMLVIGDDDEARPIRAVLEGAWGPRVEVVRPLIPVLAARLAAARTPVLFVVDELPSFGALEVETISRLAREARRRDAPLRLLVGSTTPEAPAVDALLKKAQSGTQLGLFGLDARGTGLAVAELLHRRPPPPGTVRRLLAETGGHPSLIQAVVAELVTQGGIRVRGANGERIVWAVEGDADEALPEPVRESLEERLAALSVPEIRALEVLAVAGGETASPVIARAMGVRTEQVDLLLAGLVEQDIVQWEGLPASPAVIEDSLMVRWIDETVTPVRRVVIQGLVADAVEMQQPTAAQVRVLVGVGRYAVAVQRAMTVGAALLRRGRAADAVELLETVAPHLDEPPLTDAHRVRYHLLYAACLHRIRPMDPRTARAVQAAEALATDDASRAFVAFEQSQLFGAIGHYANQVKALQAAWAHLEDEAPSRLRGDICLERAEVHMVRAELKEARRWYDQAVADAREINDREVYDRGRVGLGKLALTAANVQTAERLFADVVETEKNHPDPAIRHLALAGWSTALRWQGRWSEAIEPLSKAVAEARLSQSVTSWVAVAVAAAGLELELFRLGRAQEFVEEILEALGPGERLESRMQVRLMQGRITLASGQVATAGFQLAEVVDQCDKAGFAVLAALARAFLGEVRMLQGADTEARELYKKAMISLMTAGDQLALAEAAMSRSRAVGVHEDPAKVFILVKKLPEDVLQPLKVERLLAVARWSLRKQGKSGARRAIGDASEALAALVEHLDTIEQSAMRVHPWAHELRRASE